MSTISESISSSTLSSLWDYTDTSSSTDTSTSDYFEASASSMSIVNADYTSAYGLSFVTQLTAAAEAAFEGLGLSSGDRVTFSTISEYKEKLQTEFSETVAAGLEEAGVSADTIYQLVSSYTGDGLEVVSSSADKEKIEQFFTENPELVEDFEQIQYLSNLENTLNTESVSSQMTLSRLQIQSMSSLFLTDPSSSIMSYGDGSSYFSTGFSTFV